MTANSAKTTLRNTGIVGASRVFSILITIVKTKFIAIFIGPAGMGIMDLFTSTTRLLQSIFGLGLGFSAVKDISENIKSKDTSKIGRTVTSLRRWTILAGSIGVVFTILFRKKISMLTFGNYDHDMEIALLSVTILLTGLTSSYSALIQGSRRMGDFAKIGIYGALATTMVAIPIFYYMRENGIVLVLVLSALITLIINALYSTRINIEAVKVQFKESFKDGLGMIELGVFTVITGFITQATLYYVRTSIGDKLGLIEVGYYAAANTLAVTYMSIIFSAMSADYFPKLSAINNDDRAINVAVVEQTKIVLLLGMPLILAMYTFSEYIINIIYSKEFVAALPLLMWMLVTVFLRLIGFPIGYVFLAKGKSKIYIFTQSFWNFVFLAFVYLSWKMNGGLEGIGIAFVIAYIIGVILNIVIIKKLTMFKYDLESKLLISGMFVMLVLFFSSSYFLSGIIILLFKIFILLVVTIFCLKKLIQIADLDVLSLVKNKFS